MRINKIKMVYHGLHVDLNRCKKPDNRNFGTILIKFLKSIFSLKIYLIPSFQQKHFFYFNTNNQFEALKNIFFSLSNDSLAYFHGYDIDLLPHKYLKKYPFWLSYFFSIFASIYDFTLINRINDKFKIKNSNPAIKYIVTIILGHYYLNNILLKISRPRFIWLSNDHSYNNVGFLFAAKINNVASIYIQHASISSIFPSLRFDYSFLDGKIAHQIYNNIGICGTKVFLYGIPKMDGWVNKYSPNIPFQNVLICVNGTDNFKKFELLIDLLLENKYAVFLRKHPYLNYKFLNERYTVLQTQKSFVEALKGIDVVISGDSNVHLEATITNIPSIYFSTSDYWDYYGFLKTGLIKFSSRNELEILSILEKYNEVGNVYLKAKEFCESIGTNYQNNSTNMIINEINNF